MTNGVDNILETYSFSATKLLEILLEVQRQEELHYISRETAYYIAEKLDIKASQIYDVITFFEALHEEPRAKFPIQVCESIVCKVNESDNLLANLKEILGVNLNEATYDKRFIIEEVPCFGACDKAPAVRINDVVYGNLTSKEKIEELLKKFM